MREASHIPIEPVGKYMQKHRQANVMRHRINIDKQAVSSRVWSQALRTTSKTLVTLNRESCVNIQALHFNVCHIMRRTQIDIVPIKRHLNDK